MSSEIIVILIMINIGNNDLPVDYEPPVDEDNKYFKVLGDRLQDFIFPPLSTIRTMNNMSLFRETFDIGGFYSVNISGIFLIFFYYHCNPSPTTSLISSPEGENLEKKKFGKNLAVQRQLIKETTYFILTDP